MSTLHDLPSLDRKGQPPSNPPRQWGETVRKVSLVGYRESEVELPNIQMEGGVTMLDKKADLAGPGIGNYEDLEKILLKIRDSF